MIRPRWGRFVRKRWGRFVRKTGSVSKKWEHHFEVIKWL